LIIETSDDKMEADIYVTPPEEGRSFYGEVVFHFDPNSNKPAPKINENGSVNYRDLGIFKLCKAGDILASVEYERADTKGLDAYGNVGFPKNTNQRLLPLQGDNTFISDSGNFLIAALDGIIVMDSGKISISEFINIDGDVNSATGDIVFSGTVNVRGCVRTGYTVKADAGITIGGVVEASMLETGGDIILESGVRGANKAVINAGGSIRANFLESCAVTARGDVTADSILHCQVTCGGSILLKGRYGVLVGGKAVARECIKADSIGSAVSTPTEVYVGHNPDTLKAYQELFDEYIIVKEQYEKVQLSIDTLRAKASLKRERKKLLLNLIQSKFLFRDKMNDLRKRFDIILPEMKSNSGIIKACSKVHYGVKVMIGNAIIYIRDELANCVLSNENDRINIGING